jgi:hypothetical protein
MTNMAKLVKVQTGPTSYLKMTEAEAKAYRKEHGEYGASPESETKAADAPAEDKARKAPAAKKQDGE